MSIPGRVEISLITYKKFDKPWSTTYSLCANILSILTDAFARIFRPSSRYRPECRTKRHCYLAPIERQPLWLQRWLWNSSDKSNELIHDFRFTTRVIFSWRLVLRITLLDTDTGAPKKTDHTLPGRWHINTNVASRSSKRHLPRNFQGKDTSGEKDWLRATYGNVAYN